MTDDTEQYITGTFKISQEQEEEYNQFKKLYEILDYVLTYIPDKAKESFRLEENGDELIKAMDRIKDFETLCGYMILRSFKSFEMFNMFFGPERDIDQLYKYVKIQKETKCPPGLKGE
jgi:hypothetical protein